MCKAYGDTLELLASDNNQLVQANEISKGGMRIDSSFFPSCGLLESIIEQLDTGDMIAEPLSLFISTKEESKDRKRALWSHISTSPKIDRSGAALAVFRGLLHLIQKLIGNSLSLQQRGKWFVSAGTADGQHKDTVHKSGLTPLTSFSVRESPFLKSLLKETKEPELPGTSFWISIGTSGMRPVTL